MCVSAFFILTAIYIDLICFYNYNYWIYFVDFRINFGFA